MKEWLAKIWCALRDHPYPVNFDNDAYQDWLAGSEPFSPDSYCSNCGANLSRRRRGMHS